MSVAEDAARGLVGELIRRAKGQLQMDDETTEYLIREFTDRLDVADDPDAMVRRWTKNIDSYVSRAVKAKRGTFAPTQVGQKDVDQQFGICNEICPPPAYSSSSGSNTDGNASR